MPLLTMITNSTVCISLKSSLNHRKTGLQLKPQHNMKTLCCSKDEQQRCKISGTEWNLNFRNRALMLLIELILVENRKKNLTKPEHAFTQ